MNREDYPQMWPRISQEVRGRAAGRCECEGECGRHRGRCRAINGEHGARSAVTGKWRPLDELQELERYGENDEDYPQPSKVVLTVAHLWRGPCAEHHAQGVKCGDHDHLKALCQGCHLAYDLPEHIRTRKRNRFNKRASGDLFNDDAR